MNAPTLLTVPVTRATAPSNMSNADPTVATMPASSHHSTAAMSAPRPAMPKPMSVRELGVSPAAAIRFATGSTSLRNESRLGVAEVGVVADAGGVVGSVIASGRSAHEAQERQLPFVEPFQGALREGADD